MKKILVNISLAMLAVGGMTSCSDILDKEVDLTYTDENIYGNYDRSRGVLANAYTYLASPVIHGMMPWVHHATV